MRREIKFRAWRIESKEMLTHEETLSLIMLQGRVLNGTADDKGLLERHETMQYTGLRDKNGKEIYEGDILINTQYKSFHKYAIEWDDDNCCFNGISKEGDKYGPFTLKVSIGCGYDKKKFNTYIEIIGNIYENPELLEASDE